MTDKDALLRAELDSLVRAARLLGHVSAAKFFGQFTPEDARTQHAMEKSVREIRHRITAVLAEKDDGGWIKCSGKNGAMRNAMYIDRRLLDQHICTERNGVWYARSPLPPLPKGE